MLHRRRSHPDRAARPRSRPVELGEARSDRRRAHALPRQHRPARGDTRARRRGLRRAPVHQRRPRDLPQARGSGGGGRDAARRADRLRARHPEPQQHPDHQGPGARAGHRGRRRRHRVRCGDRDGAWRRRRPDEHRDCAGRRSGRDGRRDEAGDRGRPDGVSRRPDSHASARVGEQSGRGAHRAALPALRQRQEGAQAPDGGPVSRAARGGAAAPERRARRGRHTLQRGADRARSGAAAAGAASASVARRGRSPDRAAQRGLEHPAGSPAGLRLPRPADRLHLARRRPVSAAATHVQFDPRRSRQPRRRRAARGAPRRRCRGDGARRPGRRATPGSRRS